MRAGSRWKRFQSRLRYWLNRSERPRLLWEEMEFHIESITQELAAQGMSEPDARAAAHRSGFTAAVPGAVAGRIRGFRLDTRFPGDLRRDFVFGKSRVQEIGIRMALGASATDLQGRIVLRTLGLAALGLALGMAGSRVLSSALGSLLFGITTGDPATFIEVGTLLIAVAAIAGYIPAWKASRIDPMVALRSN